MGEGMMGGHIKKHLPETPTNLLIVSGLGVKSYSTPGYTCTMFPEWVKGTRGPKDKRHHNTGHVKDRSAVPAEERVQSGMMVAMDMIPRLPRLSTLRIQLLPPTPYFPRDKIWNW